MSQCLKRAERDHLILETSRTNRHILIFLPELAHCHSEEVPTPPLHYQGLELACTLLLIFGLHIITACRVSELEMGRHLKMESIQPR